jgi:hypothetical protein
VALFAFVSSQTGMNEHLRYVLPVFPFFQVWIGRLGPTLAAARRHAAPLRLRAAAGLVIAGLAWGTVSSLLCVPHSLAYFNETVGGRWNGWRHLVSSNVDWGQDLIALERFIAEHPETAGLALAYQGGLDPTHVGIASRPMRPDDTLRLLAAETWNLGPETEWDYFAFGGTSAAGYDRSIVPPALESRLATEKPFTRIGDATVIHRIPKPDSSEVVSDR